MLEGQPSRTAQGVAAHRLTFERVPAPYGDPAGDDTLARDVAGSAGGGPGGGGPGGPMRDYLRARTRFFDTVVVGAIASGVRQVVVGAAGYDARAIRYAHPDVSFFELDHPVTQADKRARLARLGLDTAGIAFVAGDFAVDPIGELLVGAGLSAERATLFTLEGVAVYLTADVLESLLRQLRAVAGPGSRLAISLSVTEDVGGIGAAVRAARRAAFRASVAAIGEPTRSSHTAAEVDELLATTGWRAVERDGQDPAVRDRARLAGFVIAEPGSEDPRLMAVWPPATEPNARGPVVPT